MKLEIKDLINKKYNKLTILSEAEKHIEPNGKKQRVMVCRCECGVIKNIQLKEIRSNNTKSCGCNIYKINVSDNIKYGELSVIGEAKDYISSGGHRARKVLCSCECGAQKEFILNQLRSGKVTNCGCKKVVKNIKSKTPYPTSSKKERWVEYEGYFISDKGNIFNKNLRSYLKDRRFYVNIKGESKSIHEIVYFLFNGDYSVKEKIIFLDGNRYNRKLENLYAAELNHNGKDTWVDKLYFNMRTGGNSKYMDITKKYLVEQFEKQNKVSNFLKIKMDLTGKDKLLSISVDRIDNNKGYEEGNITLVTRFENMGRGSEEYSTFKDFCTASLGYP